MDFWFEVDDKDGKPVQNPEPYMGMAGHAEFVSSDMSVFAHVHPVGSISMAPLDLTRGENGMGHCQWPCNLDPCRPRSVSHRVFQNLGSIGFSCRCGRAPMWRQRRSTPMWSDAANFVRSAQSPR